MRSASSRGSTPASNTLTALAIFGSSSTVITGLIDSTAAAVWKVRSPTSITANGARLSSGRIDSGTR